MKHSRAATAGKTTVLVSVERIERAIYLVRGEKVMLDADLARLYGVPTKALLQAVKRNAARFPPDFMLELTRQEVEALRSQTVTSIGNSSRGGRRYLPHAFTEQGVAMLSSVLRSERAVRVNVEIIRAFVRLRRMVAGHAELAHKLAQLERKCDGKFRIVFAAIRSVMSPPTVEVRRRRIGFRPAAHVREASEAEASSTALGLLSLIGSARHACLHALAGSASTRRASRRHRRR